MAFTLINTSEIEAGEPTSQELFTKIKDSLDDLNSRAATLESTSNNYLPIEFAVNGPSDDGLITDGLLITRLTFDITVLGVRLFILNAGTAGDTTIDVEYKRGAGSWTSIVSSPVTANFGDGDEHLESGTLAVTSLLAGDLIRLNVDDVQTGSDTFIVFVEFEGA